MHWLYHLAKTSQIKEDYSILETVLVSVPRDYAVLDLHIDNINNSLNCACRVS